MEDKKDTQAYYLIKIGLEEHMNQFHKKGVVYMNSVAYFRDCSNSEQGDSFEGAQIVKDGKVVSLRENYSFEKIFCMWHLNSSDPMKSAKSVTENNDKAEALYDFRDYAGFSDNIDNLRMVVIQNIKEFHNRFRRSLNAKGYYGKYSYSHVTYYNPYEKKEIEVDAFMKPITFEKQNEIRYWVLDNNEKPLVVELGDISDIAKIFPLNSIVKVKYNIEYHG